jgi:hypothetical protein
MLDAKISQRTVGILKIETMSEKVEDQVETLRATFATPLSVERGGSRTVEMKRRDKTTPKRPTE